MGLQNVGHRRSEPVARSQRAPAGAETRSLQILAAFHVNRRALVYLFTSHLNNNEIATRRGFERAVDSETTLALIRPWR